MLEKVRNTIKSYNMIEENEKILCGLSGGADSVSLLLCLLELSKELNFTVCACHLNHDLRESAQRDEMFCENLCRQYGVQFMSEKVTVSHVAKTYKIGIEEAARKVRYDFFEKCLNIFGAHKIATAHNANDSAETMLKNLASGTGISGLCGIPKKRENIIRPLAKTTREEIERYLQLNNTQYVIDETNEDVIYTRNKIRHEIVPKMCEINEKFIENTINTADILSFDREFIHEIAREKFEQICKKREGVIFCDICDIKNLHVALLSRIILFMYDYCSSSRLKYVHVENIMNLCKSVKGTKEIKLPFGTARRVYNILYIETENKTEELTEIPVMLGEKYEILDGKIEFIIRKIENCEKIHKNVINYCVSYDKINFNKMYIRKRKTGDKIKLNSAGGKSLKKLFIDEKIPKTKRDIIPVLCDDMGIIAVCGFGADISRKFKENDIVIEFNLKENNYEG